MEFFDQLRRWLEPAPPLTPALGQAIDHAVRTAAPQVSILSGYRQRLAPSVARALDYCADLVGAIPGPHAIGPGQFVSDPLIHAFFGSIDEISATLGRSEAVRDFLRDNPGSRDDVYYGLLGMRSYEKSVLGSVMIGEVMRRDVPQTVLYFSGHTVSSLGANPESVRRQLREATFDSLLQQFAAQLATVRQQRDATTATLSVERGTPRATEIERDLTQLQQRLAPESQLAALSDWLAAPEQLLYLKQIPRTMDRMGVLFPAETSPPNAEQIIFPELVGRDRRRWTVLLVDATRAELDEALAREERAHRYIVI